MKPETADHLDKATESLRKARAIAAIPIPDEAGRLAYYAAFHAAKALVFERTAKIPKRHAGVHTEFYRLARDFPAIDKELRDFLSNSYDFKRAADYEIGAPAQVTEAIAAEAIQTAERFVACVRGVLAPPANGTPTPEP